MIGGFIGFLVAGLVIGALARLLLPGRQRIGVALTLVLGVVGSVIGGSIANLVGSGRIFDLDFIGFVVAVISSVALLAVAEAAGIGARDDKRKREVNRKR